MSNKKMTSAELLAVMDDAIKKMDADGLIFRSAHMVAARAAVAELVASHDSLLTENVRLRKENARLREVAGIELHRPLGSRP